MNATVKRSIFGALFLVVMLGGLLFNRILFTILFAFITVVMLDEFYRMTMGTTYRKLQLLAACAGFAFFLCAGRYFFGQDTLAELVVEGFICIAFVMVASIFQKDHTAFFKTGFLYAGLLYIGLPLALSFAVVSRGGEFSGLLMVAFFCIIWASDIGAYCFGMLFGQKLWPAKMCPRISPKKSWAGFIGGLLMAVLAGAVISWTGLVAFPLWHCLIMAALMHVAGVLGDLFESLWKRAAGIKDSGSLIPGHGGLLDRFDSSLFAIPTGVAYLIITGLF